MTTTEQEVVHFPPGFNGPAILRPLAHPLWAGAGPDSRAYRIGLTRSSPTRFALTYLPHYLKQQETGVMSFSVLHLDLAAGARRWMEPLPRRDAWVAPRGAAKSAWLYLILPLWAIAHGHRRFFLSFAHTQPQAVLHLANLREELDSNALLLEDFPDLAPASGRAATNTKQTVTMGGATIAARGMGGTSLGLRSRESRPDLIVGDDLEPLGADYTSDACEKKLDRLVNGIFPMGSRSCVIQLTGTVVRYGSIMHQTVWAAQGKKIAPWIDQESVECHYYSPIITDPDGSRRSMWPQRWSLEELEEREGRQSYNLNELNDPSPNDDASTDYFHEGLFRYRPAWILDPSQSTSIRRILSIDSAVTTKGTSDYTACAIIATDSSRRVCVEVAFAGRISGPQLRDKIFEWCQQEPYRSTLKEVRLESNQGGELWDDILSPLPSGVKLSLFPESKNKRARTMLLLTRYEDKNVWHLRPLPYLERQLMAWPKVKNDDAIDCVSAGVEYLLKLGVTV